MLFGWSQAEPVDMMRQQSPLPASDAIISLTNQAQPDQSDPADSHGLTLSAGISLTGPNPDLPSTASQPRQGSAGSLSGALGSPSADRAGSLGKPVGRPASMQPAALIRAAREKAAAMAAVAGAASSHPAAPAQQLQQQLQAMQQTTPFGHPTQQAEPIPAAQPAITNDSQHAQTSASAGATSDRQAVALSNAGLESSASGVKQEPASGMQLAGGDSSAGISLGGILPDSAFKQDPEPQTASVHTEADSRHGQAGSLQAIKTEGPAPSGSSADKKGSQGMDSKPSIPGPAPPAGSPSASTARRVPGPRPPPGAPPPRPHPPGEFDLCELVHTQAHALSCFPLGLGDVNGDADIL